MESNWRFNVWLWGMTCAGWQLAAHRVLTNYPTYRIVVKLSATLAANYNIAAPGQLPALVNPFTPPVLHPHFPYGILVDGD